MRESAALCRGVLRYRAGLALALFLLPMQLLSMPSARADESGRTSIAVLDFESYNLTPIADTPVDMQRVASISGMLEKALQETTEVHIVSIDPAEVREADAGFGYLFEHGDVAAQLGLAHGADWVLVGRLHKPSFLFSYLMARLVDTRTGKVAEDLIVEIKGQQQVVTRKGVERLAEKLAVRLTAGKGAGSARPAER